MCLHYELLSTWQSHFFLLLAHVVTYCWFVWCLAREEEKLKAKKQNEALVGERKRLELRAAQLAESLAVSGHFLLAALSSWLYHPKLL